MGVTFYRVKNLSYILIDEFFTDGELKEVEQEIRDLKRFSTGAETTKTAIDGQGRYQKTGTGLFLDKLYLENREASAILKANRRLFAPKFIEKAVGFDIVFDFLSKSNHDSTLLNYYTQGQEYKAHHDSSRVSAVTFLREGEFTGGGFRFPSQNIEIEAVHNRTVVFPSCVLHQALPVYGGGARISIAQFVDRIE